MQRTFLRSLLVLAVVSAAIPVAAQNREHQQMTADVRWLQEQTQQIALTLAQIGEAIKALNARMDSADQVAQKRFADQKLIIETLSSDLKVVRERTQDTDTRLRKLADEVEALRSTVTSLPSLLSAPPAQVPSTDTSALDPNAPVVPPPAPQASTVGLSPGRMLETARSDYFNGAYAAAITGFEAIIRMFATSEAASEAQFLLGETNALQKRYGDAVNAYTAAIQKYPRSPWVAESYYRRGLAQESLGQPDAARASYEQLIKTYPDHDSAGLARQALNRMGRQAQTPRP